MTDLPDQSEQNLQDKTYRGGSAPSKDHFKQPFLEEFAKTGTILRACQNLGIYRSLVYAWRERDPDFAQKFVDADLSITEKLERTALTVALDKEHHSQATMLIFMLKSRCPEKYRERITHDVNINVIKTFVSKVTAIVRKHAPVELSNTIARELIEASDKFDGDQLTA